MTFTASVRGDWNDYDAVLGPPGLRHARRRAAVGMAAIAADQRERLLWLRSVEARAWRTSTISSSAAIRRSAAQTYPLDGRWWANDKQKNHNAGATLTQQFGRVRFDAGWNYIYSRGIDELPVRLAGRARVFRRRIPARQRVPADELSRQRAHDRPHDPDRAPRFAARVRLLRARPHRRLALLRLRARARSSIIASTPTAGRRATARISSASCSTSSCSEERAMTRFHRSIARIVRVAALLAMRGRARGFGATSSIFAASSRSMATRTPARQKAAVCSACHGATGISRRRRCSRISRDSARNISTGSSSSSSARRGPNRR